MNSCCKFAQTKMHNYAMILIKELRIMELKQCSFAPTKIPGGLDKVRNPWMVQWNPCTAGRIDYQTLRLSNVL